MKSTKKRQIVIAGAGLIGSTMAIALASKGLDVTVVDGTSEEDRIKRNKGRTYALSRTSKNLLINLGLWDPKKLKVSPIENIILSTRNHSGGSKRHLVRFNKEPQEVGPSSYMIEDFYLRKVLDTEINRNTKIQLINSTEVIEDQTNSFETKIILSDKNVKAILINIFGGIVRCDRVANGVVEAVKELGLDVPVVVRLEGTNSEEAKEILARSKLSIIPASDMKDAALKVVKSI